MQKKVFLSVLCLYFLLWGFLAKSNHSAAWYSGLLMHAATKERENNTEKRDLEINNVLKHSYEGAIV